jgi:hypothetical protein
MPQTVSWFTRLSNAVKWMMSSSLLLFAPQGSRAGGAFANENRLAADINLLQLNTTDRVTEFCTPPFQVNQPENNEGIVIYPQVEALAQGEAFLVAWSDEIHIKTRIFNIAGEPLTNETYVNIDTSIGSIVNILTQGPDILFTWSGRNSTEQHRKIYGRRFTYDAGILTPMTRNETRYSFDTASNQETPFAFLLDSGEEVITWVDHSEGTYAAIGADTQVQLSNNIKANSYFTSYKDGEFLMATYSPIKLTHYSPTGNPIDSINITSPLGPSEYIQTILELDDGRFFLSWQGVVPNATQGTHGIFGQLLTSNLSKQGDVFPLVQDPIHTHERPASAQLPWSKDIVVVSWTHNAAYTNSTVVAHRFSPSGEQVSVEMPIGQPGSSRPDLAVMRYNGTEVIVAAWDFFGSNDGIGAIVCKANELFGVEPVTPPTVISSTSAISSTTAISNTTAIPDATNSTNVSSTDTSTDMPPTTTPIVFYDAASQAFPELLQLQACMVFLWSREIQFPMISCMALQALMPMLKSLLFTVVPDDNCQNIPLSDGNVMQASLTGNGISLFSSKQRKSNLPSREETESEEDLRIAAAHI